MREGRVRLWVIVLVWAVLLGAGATWLLKSAPARIAIAAGPAESETFEIANAIAKVFREANPGIAVDVYETGGSTDNVRLIREGRVDLATVQADVRVTDEVQGVASLYHDAYQLIATAASGIRSFPDLAGHRVAIPPTQSGQNRSFWFVAGHFGLEPDDLVALPMAESAADFAMIHGQVDAVFRVRTPGSPSIRKLAGDHDFRLVPIRQGAALALEQPSLRPGVVPAGSYRGHPPLPVADMPTAVLERVLVARDGLDVAIVRAMTRVLFERRANLVAETKLAGFIRPLGDDQRLPFPVHVGARKYYDREKPGFVQQNARTLSGLLYVVAILTSAGLALRARLQSARRVRMADYNRELIGIAGTARDATTAAELDPLKDRLVDILQEVVHDLDGERVSEQEFDHFSFAWQAVDTLVRDRVAMLPAAAAAAAAEER